jgi:hypothetical protein
MGPVAPNGPHGFAPLPIALIERRVNALAIGWFVYGGLIGLGGLMGLAFVQAFAPHMGPWGHGFAPGFGHHFWTGEGMPSFWLRFAWISVAGRVALALAAGIGLLQKTSWGRWVAIVAAVLSVIHLPFGTVIGVWTLVVLLSAPNALGYEALVRD